MQFTYSITLVGVTWTFISTLDLLPPKMEFINRLSMGSEEPKLPDLPYEDSSTQTVGEAKKKGGWFGHHDKDKPSSKQTIEAPKVIPPAAPLTSLPPAKSEDVEKPKFFDIFHKHDRDHKKVPAQVDEAIQTDPVKEEKTGLFHHHHDKHADVSPTSVVEPAKPVAEPVKPVVEPVEPVTKPVKLVDTPAAAADKVEKPNFFDIFHKKDEEKVDAAKTHPAAAPAATPVVEPVKPLAEPVKPVAEPVKPVAEPVKPVAEPVNSVDSPVAAADKVEKPNFFDIFHRKDEEKVDTAKTHPAAAPVVATEPAAVPAEAPASVSPAGELAKSAESKPVDVVVPEAPAVVEEHPVVKSETPVVVPSAPVVTPQPVVTSQPPVVTSEPSAAVTEPSITVPGISAAFKEAPVVPEPVEEKSFFETYQQGVEDETKVYRVLPGSQQPAEPVEPLRTPVPEAVLAAAVVEKEKPIRKNFFQKLHKKNHPDSPDDGDDKDDDKDDNKDDGKDVKNGDKGGPDEPKADPPTQPTAPVEPEQKLKRKNLFQRLHDKNHPDAPDDDKDDKEDDEDKPEERKADPVAQPTTSPEPEQKPKRENLFQKLHKKNHPDAPDDDSDDDKPIVDIDPATQHPAAAERPNIFAKFASHDGAAEEENLRFKQEGEEEKANFFDVLTGKAERDEEERRRLAEEQRLQAEEEQRKAHPLGNFFYHISGQAAEEEQKRKDEEEQRLKEEQERKQHPFAFGIGKLIEGDSPKADAPPHKPNFFEKISGKADEDERKRKEEYYKKHPLAKLVDNFDEALGGGKTGEANEDLLDKAIDEFQEHVLHQGEQDDENAFEQIKDEQIAKIIRRKYKARTGREFPIRDRGHS